MDNVRLEQVKELIKKHEGAEMVDNDSFSICISLADVHNKESFISAMREIGCEFTENYENDDFVFVDSSSPEGKKAIDKAKRIQEGFYEEENELGFIKIDRDFITCEFRKLKTKGLRKIPISSIKAYAECPIYLSGNRCGDTYDFLDNKGETLASCMAMRPALTKIMRLNGIKKIKRKVPWWVYIPLVIGFFIWIACSGGLHHW